MQYLSIKTAYLNRSLPNCIPVFSHICFMVYFLFYIWIIASFTAITLSHVHLICVFLKYTIVLNL